MGCSGRAKAEDIRAEQKWDFISLNDFKSTSCFAPFAYGYLWASLIVSVAVYAVDTFTAVNLLAFDKWSGTIEPKIPLNISKWIFSACIIASWVNLGFEYLRAIRVMKRGAVAESYLDSLAVRLQCIRMGKMGRGWRRFLVFAELTKSKKGTEYVALFTFFSFQSWIRIIFCQGPRQVVNAVTLYSVFQAKLDPSKADNAGSAFVTFFKNIGLLAEENNQQAVILGGMTFTLVIWVFGALSLIMAMLFYILFLWHYIPNADGGLSGYCERKINQRLSKIVSAKVNKAIEEEERKRRKADAKAAKNGEKPVFGRQATLPTLFDPKDGDKLPNMPMLNRNDTMTTLPAYSSRPGTPSGQPTVPAFELDQLEKKRPLPSRTATGSSAMSGASYASNAPLMGNASDMGYGRSGSPAPSLPPLDTNRFRGPPARTMTANSNNSQWNQPPSGVPPRMLSAAGDRGYTASPVSYTDGRNTPGHPQNGGSQGSIDNYGRPMLPNTNDMSRSNTPNGPAPSMGRRTPFDQNFPSGRNSPAPGPGSEYGRSSPAPSAMSRAPVSPSNGGYQPYNPNMRSASSASPAPYPSSTPGPGSQQYRNMTDPGMGGRGPAPGGDYFNGAPAQRPGTANSGRGSGGSGYGGNGPPSINRLASPAPYNGGSPGFAPGPPPGQGPYRR